MIDIKDKLDAMMLAGELDKSFSVEKLCGILTLSNVSYEKADVEKWKNDSTRLEPRFVGLIGSKRDTIFPILEDGTVFMINPVPTGRFYAIMGYFNNVKYLTGQNTKHDHTKWLKTYAHKLGLKEGYNAFWDYVGTCCVPPEHYNVENHILVDFLFTDVFPSLKYDLSFWSADRYRTTLRIHFQLKNFFIDFKKMTKRPIDINHFKSLQSYIRNISSAIDIGGRHAHCAWCFSIDIAKLREDLKQYPKALRAFDDFLRGISIGKIRWRKKVYRRSGNTFITVTNEQKENLNLHLVDEIVEEVPLDKFDNTLELQPTVDNPTKRNRKEEED